MSKNIIKKIIENASPQSFEKQILEKLPQYTFSNLFANNFLKNSYSIKEKYLIYYDKASPYSNGNRNYDEITKYSTLILKKKFDIDYLSYQYNEIQNSLSSGKKEKIHLEFFTKDWKIFVKEELEILPKNVKSCEYCVPCFSKIYLKNLEKSQEFHWEEKECGITCLISYDVPQPIQNIYEEFEKKFLLK